MKSHLYLTFVLGPHLWWGRSCLQQVLKLWCLSIACISLLYRVNSSSFFPAFLNIFFFFSSLILMVVCHSLFWRDFVIFLESSLPLYIPDPDAAFGLDVSSSFSYCLIGTPTSWIIWFDAPVSLCKLHLKSHELLQAQEKPVYTP